MFGYDLKQAFTYFLKDDKKILKLTVLSVISILFVCLSQLTEDWKSIKTLLSFFGVFIESLYYYGYIAKNTNLRIIASQNSLPDVTDMSCFVVGFKNFIALLLYFIWGSLLFIATPVLLMLLSGIFMRLIAPVGILLSIIAIISVVIGSLMFLCGGFAVQIAFVTNLKIKSSLNDKLLNHILIKNIKYFLPFLFIIVLIGGVVSALCTIIDHIPVVDIVICPIMWLYWYLASSDIQAQFARKVFKIGQEGVING